jgi:hypothetical protein
MEYIVVKHTWDRDAHSSTALLAEVASSVQAAHDLAFTDFKENEYHEDENERRDARIENSEYYIYEKYGLKLTWHSTIQFTDFQNDLDASEWTNMSFERPTRLGFGSNWLDSKLPLIASIDDPVGTDFDYGVGDLD